MSRRKIKAGSTSVMLPIFVQDSTATDGSGLGSLAYNTASLAARYRLAGAGSWTTVSLVTATLGAFTSGGFIASGGVSGSYEVGIPDAALAAGAAWVEIEYYGAANMVPVKIEIELDAVDYQDATAFGLSRLDAAVSSRSSHSAADVWAVATRTLSAFGFSVPVSDKTGFKLASDGLPTMPDDWITAAGLSVAAVGKIEAALLNEGDGQALINAMVAAIDAADIDADELPALVGAWILNRVLAGNHDTAGTPGKILQDIVAKTVNIPAAPASTGDVTGARDQVLTRLGTPADTDLAKDIAAVKTDTGNLVTRITSTLFAGITSLAGWLRLTLRNDAPIATDHAAELSEINQDMGAGAGTYDPTVNAQQAPVSVALGPDDIQDIVEGVSQGLSFPTAGDIAAELAGNNVVATFPLLIEGEETVIIQGEDYFDADGNAATVTITATGIEAAVSDGWDFIFWGQSDSTGQVVAGSPSSGGANTITVKFDLPAAKTSLVTAGLGGWRVVHKPDATTRRFSEVEGLLRVKPAK